MFAKPTIVLSKTEDELYHGSGRNYDGINMVKMLDYAKNHILTYGGHEGAAGLTVENSEIEKFIESLDNYASSNFSIDMFKPYIKADMQVS